MMPQNRLAEAYSISVLIVKGFYEALLAPLPPHFLGQVPEVLLPDANDAKDRALSDAEQQAQSTAKQVEKSATPSIAKKGL